MAIFVAIGALVVGIAIAYLLRPKVPSRNDATKDLENPTADAGRPIPVVFGTITVKSPNVLWFGDKSHRTYKVKV